MKKVKPALNTISLLACAIFSGLASCSLVNSSPGTEITFEDNSPFNADLENGFDCREAHPNLPHPNPALDAGVEVEFESLSPEVKQLTKKYVYALGYCLFQVLNDAQDSNTYEFILLDLVSYDFMEMDIVDDPDEGAYVEEFERQFSLKRLKHYQNLGSVNSKIEKKCRDFTEEYSYNPKDASASGVKVEISYRDLKGTNQGVYPGLTLVGNEIYFEVECLDADGKRWLEFTVPE